MTDRALKAAATRAGLSVAEYTDRLDRGLLYCFRDQDWHPADAFAVDGKRVSGRAASCTASVRRARDARRDAGILDEPGNWEIRVTVYRNGRRVGTCDTTGHDTFDKAAYWAGEGLNTREIDLHQPKRRTTP